MKILQINCVYGVGSTGKITKDIHESLSRKGYDSVVIYGRQNKVENEYVYKLCPEWYAKLNNLRSRISGIMYGGAYISTMAIKHKIKKENPDIVHIQCINGYFCNIFELLKFLKIEKIKTVLTLHAEFMYTANCGYAGECNQWIEGCKKCPKLREETLSMLFDKTRKSWKKMHQIYSNWDELCIVGCSQWIVNRASNCESLKNKKIVTIHNGIDNDKIFYPQKDARRCIRDKYSIASDKKIILYVAPVFSKLKGFDYIVDLIEQSNNLPFHFILAGDTVELDNDNVTVVGKIADQKYLSQLYSAADAFVISSRDDNYPTVCLEAISCGTPIVGFDVGGVGETIYSGMGGVVPLGDIEAMKNKLLEVTNNKLSEETIEAARKYHSKERMVLEYEKLYSLLI